MDILLYVGMFIVSLAVLLKASDWFVESAEEIGLSFGISPFIIGVTIVAFGTSLPELAASIAAVLGGNSEIVVGTVVGSNITNILLVLSLTAILGKEIILDYNVMDTDMPLLAGSALFMWFVLRDLQFDTFESVIFIGGIIAFLINTLKGANKSQGERPKANYKSYLLLLLGGVLVSVGANYTILSIQNLSSMFDINPEVIALTCVALGTSLPEVVVSITAARKGKSSMAIGNVLGSNLFNTYAVMGIPGLLGTLVIPPSLLEFSLPFMVGITFMFGLVCASKKISRWEGSMLLVFYIYYLYEIIKLGII